MRWTVALALIAAMLGVALGISLTWADLGPYRYVPPEAAADGGGPAFDTTKPLPRAVVVDSDTHDFGFMEQDTKGSHTFQIRNDGDAPLTLAKGSTTCKCTLSNLQNNRLQPGDTAKVELEWTTSEQGPFRHSATIRTNDPRSSLITLTIEGRVSRSHKVSPPELRFSSINVGDGATGELYVYSFDRDKLDISRQAFSDPATADYFELEIEEMSAEQVAQEEAAKAGKIIRVAVKPGLPLGPLNQRIRLRLDLPGEPTVEVPISGQVVGDISIVGPRPDWNDEWNLLALGTVKSDQGAEKRGMYLLAKGDQREHLDLKMAGVRPDFLQIQFDDPEPVPGQKVTKIPFTIKVPAGAEPGDHTGAFGKAGRIEIDTGHPTTPRLLLRVTFRVEK